MRPSLVRLLAVAVVVVAMGMESAAATAGEDHPTVSGGSRRLAGPDRYATSLAAIQDVREMQFQFDSDVHALVVARGDVFPDALAAPTAMERLGVHPLALTPPGELRDDLADLIRTSEVHIAGILGDEEAVSAQVEAGLVDLEMRIDFRAAGRDRYETARRMVEAVMELDERTYGPAPVPVVLVSGANFPDAIAAAPLARIFDPQAFVMITTPDRLHPDARWVIEHHASNVVIVGGEQAVSAAVQAEVAAMVPTERIAGADRTETAALVAERVFDHWIGRGGTMPSVAIARGDLFPDALSAGMWAAVMGVQPLLLTRSPSDLGDAARRWLTEHADQVDQVVVFGDRQALSEDVFTEAKRLATVTR